MNNCTVSENKVNTNGVDYSYPPAGGIYNGENASLKIIDGVVKDNIAATAADGNGIYNSGTFIIGGSFYIKEGNEIYLNTGSDGNKTMIAIASPLTQNHVAKIVIYEFSDGASFSNGIQVLTLTEDSSTTLPAEHTKFSLPQDYQNGDYVQYSVDEEGKIN